VKRIHICFLQGWINNYYYYEFDFYLKKKKIVLQVVDIE